MKTEERKQLQAELENLQWRREHAVLSRSVREREDIRIEEIIELLRAQS